MIIASNVILTLSQAKFNTSGMAEAEDSMEAGKQTNKLVSQLLSNVFVLTHAMHNNRTRQARRTHENIEEELSTLFQKSHKAC